MVFAVQRGTLAHCRGSAVQSHAEMNGTQLIFR